MTIEGRAQACITPRSCLHFISFSLLLLVGIVVEGSDFPPLAGLPRGTPVLFGSGAWAPYRELGLTNLVQVDANRGYVVGLRADGTVVRWGSLADDSFTASLERIVSVSAGGAHTLALREDGQLYAWIAEGNVFQDQILPIPTGLGAVERMAAGYNHSVVVDIDGRVWAWGATTHGPYDPPAWATNAVGLTAGQLYSAVILPDGQVRGWYPPGWETAELPPPAHAPSIQVDASIFMHVLSLRSDGRVFGWGPNDYGQVTVPVGLDQVIQVAAGGNHSAALREDGTVVVWGDNSNGQLEVPSNYRFFAIAAADYFTVGLTRGPVVTEWPNTVWTQAGSDVELAVPVAASDAYTAYWYQENALVATGSTSAILLTNVQPALSGTMRMVVSNAYGFAEQPFPLVVEDAAPRVLRQPVSIAVMPGGTARFEVEARGSEPLSYQWQFQGVDIPDATSSHLELVGVTPAASGPYRVVVRNAFGEVWGQPAYLSAGPPLILEEPLSLYQFAGWDTRLSVAVLSPEPLSYQWYRDGVELTGQQAPALALEQATTAILGAYQVVAANSFGAATSAVARVRLFEPVAPAPSPSLLVAVGANHGGKLNFPRDLTNAVAVAMGDVHGLALRADGQLIGWGGEDGSADWDPAAIPSTSSVKAIAAGRFHNLVLQQDGTVRGWGSQIGENHGQWSVPEGLSNVVAVSAGHQHSLALRENGTVMQWPMPETFPSGARNVIAVAAGSGSSMLLEADGTVWDWTNYTFDNPRRQRFQNPQAIAIAVSDWGRWCLLDDGVVLTWNNSDSPPVPYPGGEDIVAIAAPPVWWGNPFLLRADGRIYSADWGWLSGIEQAQRIASSFDAVAALTRAPYLDETPASTLVEPGQTLTLNAAARSSTVFVYQWEKDGVEIPGATGATLTIPTVTAFDRGEYRVRVLNEDHVITSPPATVGVTGPVEFKPMDSLVVSAGADVSVSPVWAGEAPVTFVWQRDGVDIASADVAELLLTNVQAGMAGEYRLMASNPYGTSFSSSFQIEVTPSIPWIQTPPVPVALPAGSEAVFEVEARGSEPLEWQWHWNDVPLVGATNRILHLRNVQSVVAGSYSVEVRNLNGTIRTEPVALTVIASPPVPSDDDPIRLALEGNRVVLDRALIGSEPMTYQWRYGGVDIAGETGRQLELAAVAAHQAGLYTLAVRNALGQAETPPLELRVVPVLGDGVVVGWGNNPLRSIPTNIVALDGGSTFALALDRSGTVSTHRSTPMFELLPPDDLAGVVKVSVGSQHALALLENGTIAGWGYPGPALSEISTNLVSAVDVATGASFGVVLDADGQVIGWGRANEFTSAPFLVPDEAVNVVDVAAHERVAVALRADGTLVWMGTPASAVRTVPAAATNLVAIDLGERHAAGLRADGSVFVWGSGPGAVAMPAATNVIRIACGPNHTLALRADGTVLAGGDARSGKTNVPEGLANVVGIAAGGDFSLAITRNPVIVTNLPTTYLAVEGASAELAIHAVGTGQLRYRWFHDGVELTGQTDMLLSIPEVRTNDAGYYHARVENDWGATLTRTNRLTVLMLPRVAVEPVDLTVPAGMNTNLQVTAIGQPPLTYQWRFNGSPIPEAQSARLDLLNLQAPMAGGYDVLVNNAYGATTSRVAQVRVATSAPGFIVSPAPTMVLAGNPLRLSAQVFGSEPIQYSWRRDGVLIARTDAARLEIANAQAADAGTYLVTASNAFGQATSLGVAVTVRATAPRVMQQPSDLIVSIGEAVEFTPVIVGTEPITFRWMKDGVTLPGFTNAQFRLSAARSIDQGGYLVVANNTLGTAMSRSAALAVDPPAILLEPVDQTVSEGADVTFSAVASGSDPRVYRWTRNGGSIAGSGADLRLRNVQAADAGAYRVTVSNATGMAASRAALLVVEPAAPRLAQPPRGHTTLERGLALLHVDARGTPPLAYQWYHDGMAIPGAVGPSLPIPRATLADAGNYRVTVTNQLGSVSSDPVSIVVLPAPSGIVASWGPVDHARPAITNAVQLVWGFTHGLALTDAGEVVGWGYFDPAFNQHVVPTGLANVVRIAAGGVHSVALRADGTVVGWGDNYYGQYSPPPGVEPLRDIAAARFHTAGIDAFGRIALFGGDTVYPVAPPADGTNTVRVVTGDAFVAGLRADGSVAVWSLDGLARFPVPENLELSVDLAAGSDLLMARHPDGGVTTWSALTGASLPVPLDVAQVVSIAAGNGYFVVQRADGTLRTWGSGAFPQPEPLTAAAAGVFAGWDRAATIAALSVDYSPAPASVAEGDPAWFQVTATGRDPLRYQWFHEAQPIAQATNAWLYLPQTTPAESGSYQVEVAAHAASASVATTLEIQPRRHGALVGWGNPANPVLQYLDTVPPRVRAVSGMWGHAVALLDDGTVRAWGVNDRGQTNTPAGLSDVVQVATGEFHNLALRRDGQVVGWGGGDHGQHLAPLNLTNVAGIAAGWIHSLAVRRDGTVVCWGYDAYGQSAPPPLRGVVAVAGTFDHSAALHANGTLTEWGYYYGARPPLAPLVKLAGMGNYFGAITDSGAVHLWPEQVGAYPALAPAEALAIGPSSIHSAPHFVSLLSGLGLVRCAGSNNAGESVPPTWLRNVIAVGAANEVSLAVTTLSLREEPGDVGALAGAGITLAVDAIGAEPISYQWYRDGQPIPGALSPTLHIAQSTTADSGTYTVTVSNPFATLASRPASVAILNAEWPLMEWGNLLLTADGFLTAAARVEPGRTYDLLVSSDLTNWIPLQTIVADQSVWLIREQPHPDVPVLFFRLMLVP